MDRELKAMRAQIEQQAKEVEMQVKQHSQDLATQLAARVVQRPLN